MTSLNEALSLFMPENPEMRELILKYIQKTPKSMQIYKKALSRLPGGVESPVRYNSPYPLYIVKSKGSRLYDADGNSYIDYNLAFGLMIAGHSHPKINEAVKEQVELGSMYGFPSETSVKLANEINKRYPVAEMVRFCNSGSEAVQAAVRLARAYTNKDKIVKIEGCFHGCIDPLFCSIHTPKGQEGPRWAPSLVPESLGIPKSAFNDIVIAPFNDIEALEKILVKNEGQIAAVILEPIIGSLGVIPPEPNYLKQLRKLTREHNVLLIFDEVKTGCRVAYGGAAQLYNVEPDIIVLGKVIGGGYPLSAFGAKSELMNMIAPKGEVWQMGTYNANPVSVVAGLTCLKDIMTEDKYKYLNTVSDELFNGLKQIAQDAKIKASAEWVGSFGCIRFTDKKIRNYRDFQETLNEELYDMFWKGMMLNGVLISGPSAVNDIVLSIAHTREDINTTLEAAKNVFNILKKL